MYKWISFRDTFICDNCNFAYFPTDKEFFNNRLVELGQLKFCPNCGEYKVGVIKEWKNNTSQLNN